MNDADELKLDDEEAMQFHYFKLHDYDNNNKMDGLELGAAMTHYHDTDSGGEEIDVRLYTVYSYSHTMFEPHNNLRYM